MKVYVCLLLLVSMTFFVLFESGATATVELPTLIPNPPSLIHNHETAEKHKLEARCPPLDPCKVGNKYMELYENIRKSVNCPPQPQRCSGTTSTTTTTTTTTTTEAARLTSTKPSDLFNKLVLCELLKSDLENKFIKQMYSEAVRTKLCQHHFTSPIVSILAKGTNTTVTPAIVNVTNSTIASSTVAVVTASTEAVVAASTKAVVAASTEAVVAASTEAVVAASTKAVVAASTEAVVAASTEAVVAASTEAVVASSTEAVVAASTEAVVAASTEAVVAASTVAVVATQ